MTGRTEAPLPDGAYDAIVVEADDRPGGGVTLSLTVLVGEHKGTVVDVAAPEIAEDVLFLLGIPGTLVVEAGSPRVVLEP